MSFKTRGQLKDHENRHSNLRPFKCYICGNSFNRKTRLKVHIMIHTGEKPFKCSFPDCGKTFREKGNLNSHLKKHLGTTTDIKPVQYLEKTGSTGEDIKDSNKSTTSYYNDVNDIIDRLCGDSKGTVQKEDDELSLNELNVYYPTAEILLDNKQEENFN